MPEQSPQRVPLVAVLVDVRHAIPQARLQVLGMVLEQQHHQTPRHRGEHGPCVVADFRVQRLGRDDGQAVARLDGEARQAEGNAREDVDDNLLADGRDFAVALGALAEDEVAAEKAGEEGVEGACWRWQVSEGYISYR